MFLPLILLDYLLALNYQSRINYLTNMCKTCAMFLLAVSRMRSVWEEWVKLGDAAWREMQIYMDQSRTCQKISNLLD
jgi:hypothetical protein